MPLALAAPSPALVRSLAICLSNSAKATTIAIIILPAEVVVAEVPDDYGIKASKKIRILEV